MSEVISTYTVADYEAPLFKEYLVHYKAKITYKIVYITRKKLLTDGIFQTHCLYYLNGIIAGIAR